MFRAQGCGMLLAHFCGLCGSLCLHTALLHRSDSVTMNNFFSSVDGQLELLAQGALDNALSSMGALHALRPRLDRFHQLLLEPPKVGDMGCCDSRGEWGWKRKYPVYTKPSLFL